MRQIRLIWTVQQRLTRTFIRDENIYVKHLRNARGKIICGRTGNYTIYKQ